GSMNSGNRRSPGASRGEGCAARSREPDRAIAAKAVDDPMQQKPPNQETGEPKQQDNRKPLRHRHRWGGLERVAEQVRGPGEEYDPAGRLQPPGKVGDGHEDPIEQVERVADRILEDPRTLPEGEEGAEDEGGAGACERGAYQGGQQDLGMWDRHS